MAVAAILCKKTARAVPGGDWRTLDLVEIRVGATFGDIPLGAEESAHHWFLGISGFPNDPVYAEKVELSAILPLQEETETLPYIARKFTLSTGEASAAGAILALLIKMPGLFASLIDYILNGGTQSIPEDVEVVPWASATSLIWNKETGSQATAGDLVP